MTGFIVVAALMVCVALAWVLVPLLRGRAVTGGVERRATNIEVLRDQFAELGTDLRDGVLSQEQYDEARAELERRGLEESRATERTLPRAARKSRIAVVALGVMLPVAAVSLYALLGNPAMISEQPAGSQHAVSREQIEKLVTQLAARLEKAPDDLRGWAMLAHSYSAMGRHADAVVAFEHLMKLAPNDADMLADYADALALMQGQNLEGKPLELVNRALAIDPNQWKALALAGTAAFNRKDYRGAIEYWEKLRTTLPPDSPVLESVKANIAEAGELGGIKPVPTKDVPAQRSARPAAVAASISGKVTLSPELTAKVSPDDTLFIFARAEGGSGMPLAILRKRAGDFPVSFTLDDSAAMVPGTSLGSVEKVVVGALISKSGSASVQRGDLQGFASPVRPGARDVSVVVNTVHP
jgi:cytochrome c-type biogenesis protein CcmH